MTKLRGAAQKASTSIPEDTTHHSRASALENSKSSKAKVLTKNNELTTGNIQTIKKSILRPKGKSGKNSFMSA